MRFVLLCFIIIISINSYAQCKTYTIGRNKDTLNCVDRDGLKQGKWIIKMEPVRGNPGYEEEGMYKDDRKEGLWRRYSLMGDVLAIESYRWGFKDGISQYYTVAGLEREESWKAINPADPYDTIWVVDVYDDTKMQQVRVKREGESYEHGTWKYYQPGGSVIRVEQYDMGKVVEKDAPKVVGEPVDSTGLGKPDKQKMKPKEVIQFEKKYNNKKKIKVRDGRTGG